MNYYAVIDTNVLVSAMLKWDSTPGNIMELVFAGMIVPLLNEHIVKEYREVLSRAKFHLTREIIHDVLAEIKRFGVYVDAQELDIELTDPKDRVFYEVVMEKRKTEDAYLVTGNIRHFPSEPYIVTPRQMLDIIVGNMDE
ncbi:MAG: putative toxin-antitoxin system toxin component, PIN family [Ruminococcus sp.]